MRNQQHLFKHGNATGVTIPREFLYQLKWVCGQAIFVELPESLDHVIVRLPRYEDFGGAMSPQALAAAARERR